MFRRFAVLFPIPAAKVDKEKDILITAKGDTTWQRESEILVDTSYIARIVPHECGFPFIVMKDGTSWLSAIEYNFLAEALDGLKL